MVLDSDRVDEVIAAGSNFESVRDAVLDLTSSSALGYKLFGHCLAVLVVNTYSKFATEQLDLAGDTLTAEQWDTLTELFAAKAEELRVDEVCPEPRDVKMPYFTFDLDLHVKNSSHEGELALSLKVLAIKHHQLQQMWFEKEVMGVHQKSATDPRLPESKLRQFVNFRNVFEDKIPPTAVANGALLMHQFRLKENVFFELDNSSAIEKALAQALTGKAGQEALEAKALFGVPGDGR